jgi:hypothetical protein
MLAGPVANQEAGGKRWRAPGEAVASAEREPVSRCAGTALTDGPFPPVHGLRAQHALEPTRAVRATVSPRRAAQRDR